MTGSKEVRATVIVSKVEPPREPAPTTKPAQRRPIRFHGSVAIDPTRVVRDAGRIADEIIVQLASIVGSDVTVSLEIEAQVPDGEQNASRVPAFRVACGYPSS